MPRPDRRPLSPDELRVIGRFVQAVADGRYDAIAKAARACLQELERIRPGSAPARSYLTVYSHLFSGARSARRGSLNSFWTPAEQAVVDRSVKALVLGRFRTAQEAADACHGEFTRRWQRRPATSPVVPRTRQAIFMRILKGAQAAGYTSIRERWTPAEVRVLNRHVEALVRGRFSGAGAAAASCHAEMNRLLPRPPARTRLAVRDRLERRARRLGWKWNTTRWQPQVRRLLETYARKTAQDRNTSLKAMVRACHKRISCVYDSFRAGHPSARDGYVRPTFSAVKSFLERRAGELGRHFSENWRPDEEAVVDRYARALLDGEYENGDVAALACRMELADIRRRWRKADPRRYNRTRERSYLAVHERICELAHAHKRRWPKTAWTAEETRVLRRWFPWYRKHRRARDFPAMKTAAEGIQEELERLGSRRSVPACFGRFAKEWLRRQRLT
jgi:hypothetical protein